MTRAQPETLGNTLFDKMQGYIRSRQMPSEFELRRIWADAEKLAEVDAAQASIVKAAISVFRNNQDEVHYWSNNAVRIEPTTTTFINASVNLRYLGDFVGAADMIENAVALAPMNDHVVARAAEILAAAGRLSRAIEITSAIPQKPEYLEAVIHDLNRRLQGISTLGISEEELQQEIILACDVARENNIRVVTIDGTVCEYSTDEFQVVLSFRFVGDIERELDLESQFAAKLSDLPNWDPLKLNIEFRYLKPHELQPH